MKKISVLFLLSLEIFFGCGLNAQTPPDELGIRNEKDFVKFIKSIAVDENKSSESKYTANFTKIIKNSSNVITINLFIQKDLETGYKFDSYSGDMKVIDIAKYKPNSNDGFSKSRFKFITFEDLIMGQIIYYTGPGPYRESGGLLVQFVDEKKYQNSINVKSIPSIYESVYRFEIKRESDKINMYTELSKSVNELKNKFDLKKNELVLKEIEIKSKNESVVKKDDKKKAEKKEEEEEEEEEEEVEESDEPLAEGDDFEISSEQKFLNILNDEVRQLERRLSDSLYLLNKYEKEHFYNVNNSNPFPNEEKFTIVSNPKLLSKRLLWEDNGNIEKRNFGYYITYEPTGNNDTLSYAYWNPKRNGKIYEYMMLNGNKVQKTTGEYKNGLLIGDMIEYEIINDKRVFKKIESYNNEGKLLKLINYNNYHENRDVSYYGKKVYINYQSRIINYDPLTGQMNGLYEEYQELYESIGTLKQPQSKITIILKLSGNYSNGKRVGEWKEFFANGKLKSKINYSTGESETYSEYGDLLNKTFKKIQ